MRLLRPDFVVVEISFDLLDLWVAEMVASSLLFDSFHSVVHSKALLSRIPDCKDSR